MARKSWLARAIESFRSPAPKAPTPTNEIEVVSSFLTGRPVSIDDFDPKRLMDEGYRRNVIVYTCVNEIASSAAVPRAYLRDRKTQDEVEEHPLLDLLARPAPALSFYELMETLLIHQNTAGTGYLHKGRNGSGQIIQLKTARPDRIQPVPDKQGNLLWYEYRIEGAGVQRIEPDDLAPFKLPDPLNDFHGLSPLHVASIYGDIDTAAAQYLRDFFANGAMPMGLLKFKVPSVRREDRLRVQQEWGEIYGAGEINPNRGGRWHNVGVLGGDVEYQAIASEPAQLRLDAVWGMTESRLCATFGVPPQLVQARIGLQYSTYSNMREARRSFWTETLVPIYRRLGDSLTRNIVSEYDEGLDLVFDLESIPELQEDLNARATRASQLFLGGLASFNEARLLSDLEESKTDFYAFPQSVKMVSREEVESGAFLEKPEPEPEPPPPGAPPPPPGEEEPPDDEDEEEEEEKGPPLFKPGEEGEEGERQAGPPFEVLGLRGSPEEAEAEIMRSAPSLEAGFSDAVREGVAASDISKLASAIEAGNWRAAERAVAIDRFSKRYSEALRAQLTHALSTAFGIHYRHHAGEPREMHHGDHDQKSHGGGGGGGGAKRAIARVRQASPNGTSGLGDTMAVPFRVEKRIPLLPRGREEKERYMKVPLSKLVTTQESVYKGGVISKIREFERAKDHDGGTRPIKVGKVGSKFYIWDGNHRAAAAKALGWKSIMADVVG